jgi:hypothetical protein
LGGSYAVLYVFRKLFVPAAHNPSDVADPIVVDTFAGVDYLLGDPSARALFYISALQLLLALAVLYAVIRNRTGLLCALTAVPSFVVLSIAVRENVSLAASDSMLNLWIGFEPLLVALGVSTLSAVLLFDSSELRGGWRLPDDLLQPEDNWEVLAVATGWTVVTVGTALVVEGLTGLPGLLLGQTAPASWGVDYLLGTAEDFSLARGRLLAATFVGLATLILAYVLVHGTLREQWTLTTYVLVMGLPSLWSRAPVARASAAAGMLLFVSTAATTISRDGIPSVYELPHRRFSQVVDRVKSETADRQSVEEPWLPVVVGYLPPLVAMAYILFFFLEIYQFVDGIYAGFPSGVTYLQGNETAKREFFGGITIVLACSYLLSAVYHRDAADLWIGSTAVVSVEMILLRTGGHSPEMVAFVGLCLGSSTLVVTLTRSSEIATRLQTVLADRRDWFAFHTLDPWRVLGTLTAGVVALVCFGVALAGLTGVPELFTRGVDPQSTGLALIRGQAEEQYRAVDTLNRAVAFTLSGAFVGRAIYDGRVKTLWFIAGLVTTMGLSLFQYETPPARATAAAAALLLIAATSFTVAERDSGGGFDLTE